MEELSVKVGNAVLTLLTKLYYEELTKLLAGEMLQAALGLLCQGMLEETAKGTCSQASCLWKLTPGFSSALGTLDANLRTGIFLGHIL